MLKSGLVMQDEKFCMEESYGDTMLCFDDLGAHLSRKACALLDCVSLEGHKNWVWHWGGSSRTRDNCKQELA